MYFGEQSAPLQQPQSARTLAHRMSAFYSSLAAVGKWTADPRRTSPPNCMLYFLIVSHTSVRFSFLRADGRYKWMYI